MDSKVTVEVAGGLQFRVSDFPSDHSHDRAKVLDLLFRHGQVITVEHSEVRELSGFETTEIILSEQRVRVGASMRSQRCSK